MTQPLLGAEGDDGVLVIKSGTDFRDLSEIHLELEDAPEGSVRRKYISAVHGMSRVDGVAIHLIMVQVVGTRRNLTRSLRRR